MRPRIPAPTPSELTRPTSTASRAESAKKRGPCGAWRRVWRRSSPCLGSAGGSGTTCSPSSGTATRRGDRAADALRDLERLLGRRLREEDAELLAAEAGRHVVVAELGAEDLRDALEEGVAGQMAVAVVD